MDQMTQGQMTQCDTKKPPGQRNVKLTNKRELKKWADIGPRSVAAAARYRKEPERKQQEPARSDHHQASFWRRRIAGVLGLAPDL